MAFTNKNSKQRKVKAALMYSVGDVPQGYMYWRQKLLNHCLNIFIWDNLPESLPARELESNLIMTGHAVIMRDPKTKNVVCPITELYGYDMYYRPTGATYGNVLLPFKRLIFGENSEVIYNDKLQGNILREQYPDTGLMSFIGRYARQLADIESSINAYIINTRSRDNLVVKSQLALENVEDYNLRVELGERSVLTDDSFLGSIRALESNRYDMPDDLNSLLIARDKILSCFFRDIGVKFLESQKRAQMTEDEVQADEQMLVINIEDLKREREEGLTRIRESGLFPELDAAAVRINPVYDRTSYQGTEEREEAAESDNQRVN